MSVTLKDVGSGYKRTAINSNFEAIEAEINNNLLSKNGGVGLEADLDANSQKVINLAGGILASDAVNLRQLQGAISAAGSGLITSQTEVQLGSAAVANVFTFTGITYTVGGNNLYVFRNGQKLGKTEDYTETSSNSVTLTFTPNDSDRFEFITNVSTTNSTTVTSAISHTSSGSEHNLAEYLVNREVVSVMDFGVDNTGATDNTTEWAAAEAAAEGKILFVPKGTYLKNRTFPKSNTTYWFAPGCVINGTTGGNNTWRVQSVSNVHFFFNGATINRDSTGTSANFYFAEAVDCSANGGNFVSGGASKDCIYIGGAAIGTQSERVAIRGGSCVNALRNGISVVAAYDTLIEGVEIHGTTGGPGAGIDLEANRFDQCLRTTIRNCVIHDNAQSGIGCVFADTCNIYDNYIYDNGGNGIGLAAGGTQFDIDGWTVNDVARIEDVRGVSAFDTANGWITANNVSDTGGNRLNIGDVVIFNTRNGATLPTELTSQVRWTVTEISTVSNHLFRVGTANEYGKLTSFSGAGTGTMSLDRDTSDIILICYNRDGQNSGFNIYNNRLENNGGTGDPEISFSTGTNCKIYGNTIVAGLDKSLAVRNQYSTNVSVYDNTIYLDKASTAQTMGINFGQCANISTGNNKVYNATGEGLSVSGCSGGRFINDYLYNCGDVGTRALRMQNGQGAVMSPVIRQDQRGAATYGIRLESTTSNCLVTGADCYTAGNNNTNSISDGGTNNRVVDSRLNDGTWAP